jgi:sulfur carrier protein
MKIILNGQTIQVPENSDIHTIVEQFCKDRTPVIAEINGSIVAKPQWERSLLKDGDTVELVSFVGGG